MPRPITRATVLARISDLCEPASDDEAELPSSLGRVLNQALSFKLLAAVAVLLIAVALWLGRRTDNRDTAKVDGAWQPQSPARAAETAPAWSPTAKVVTPAPGPACSAPDAVQLPIVAQDNRIKATQAEPAMSQWPNPNHATAVSAEVRREETPIGANRAMAIRPEYLGKQQ